MADENEPTQPDEPGDEGMRLAAEDTAKADAARPNINNLGRVDREGRLVGAAFPYQVGEGAGITPEGDMKPLVVEKAEQRDDPKDEAKERELKRADAGPDQPDAETRTRRTPGEKR